jgi:hypothetical protein
MMDFSQLAVSIDSQRSGAMVIIRPHIENPVPLTLQYRMTVRQSSVHGTSSINQQGEVQSAIAANSVSINLPTDGQCRVHLQLFHENALIKEIDSDCTGLPD